MCQGFIENLDFFFKPNNENRSGVKRRRGGLNPSEGVQGNAAPEEHFLSFNLKGPV